MFENHSEDQLSDMGTGEVADGKALINELDFAGFENLKSNQPDFGKGELSSLELTDSDGKIQTTKNWEQKPDVEVKPEEPPKFRKTGADSSTNTSEFNSDQIVSSVVENGLQIGLSETRQILHLWHKSTASKDDMESMRQWSELDRKLNENGLHFFITVFKSFPPILIGMSVQDSEGNIRGDRITRWDNPKLFIEEGWINRLSN